MCSTPLLFCLSVCSFVGLTVVAVIVVVAVVVVDACSLLLLLGSPFQFFISFINRRKDEGKEESKGFACQHGRDAAAVHAA